MSIGLVYIALLMVGVVYALIAGALGWLGDLAGGDIHVDAGGHLDAGHAHSISGTIVATFVTGFGGGGVLAHYLFRWSLVKGLGFAAVAGLALAAAAFGILEAIFKQTQGGSEFASGEMVGREAEVITPIPANGVGEVALQMKGQRERASARTLDGSAVPRGQVVVIDKVTGSTVFVRPRTGS
jgi:membrane protein implicated in regulation of membrane protease activity